ncbi:MAG TPA: hypothetical protein VJL81_15715, partial [Solirubrobacterales bacterium]|nr:hypothetical protein [Solirubrobacterales bacterium]
ATPAGPGGGGAGGGGKGGPGRAATTIRLRANDRSIRRGGHAFLTVTVAPCNGRKGEPVTLRVGRRAVAKAELSGVCKAHFHPRIDHRVRFRVAIAADATYAAATSDKLSVRIRTGAGARG